MLAASAVLLAGCCSEIAKPDAPVTAWQQGPALPRRVSDAGVGAFGLRLVVAGGTEVDAAGRLVPSARIDTFHTTELVWEALPDLPVARTSPSVGAIGSTLIVVGGFDAAGQPSGEGFALDPLDNEWLPIAALDPSDARGGAGVIAAPGRLYLIGGASAQGALASGLEYDLAVDRWRLVASLPEPRAFPAVMRREDNTLIVAGGFADAAGSEPRSEVWALPPALRVEDRTWKPRMPMPGDAGARGGCAYGVVLGELVCAGGEGRGGARAEVASYDATRDAWTVREAMPIARVSAQGAAIGGRVYVVGGGVARGEPSDALYVYRPLDVAP